MAPGFAASLLGPATCGWSGSNNCQCCCLASDGAWMRSLRMRSRGRPPAGPCILGGLTLSGLPTSKSARMQKA
jgi:hypothetical protein